MPDNLRNEDMEKVLQEIQAMMLTRLSVFADVIQRYINLRIQDNETSWLRANAILFIITRGGRITPSQLADILLRSRNSVTKIVEGLEKDGLVKRTHSDEDRRTVYIEVTQAGLEYIMRRLRAVTRLEDEVRSCLDDSELQTLVTLTRKLRLKLIEKITGLKS